MGEAKGIHREAHAAEQEYHGIEAKQVAAREQRGQQRRQRRSESHGGEHPAAVMMVGQAADRPLETHAAENARTDENRDLRDAEADAAGIDGGHGKDRAVRHAGAQRADDAERRCPEEGAQTERLRGREIRGRRDRDGNRHQRHGDQHGSQHEQHEAVGIAEIQEELAARHTAQHHHHVDRQHAAAGLVGGALIEPGFGDDIESGIAETGDQAHDRPHPGVDENRMQERSGRSGRGQGGENPHMADVAHHLWCDDGAGQETQKVTGHDEAGDLGRKGLRTGANAEQRTLQAVPQHQHAEADEEGPSGLDGCQHSKTRNRGAEVDQPCLCSGAFGLACGFAPRNRREMA